MGIVGFLKSLVGARRPTAPQGQVPQESAKQRAEIVSLLGADVPKKAGGVKKEVAPKYWLPHTGETWSGRGRTPRAFAAWEGTSAYTTWKASHPNEKFPAFPG